MKKIAIVIDNVAPNLFNKFLFEALPKFYKENNNDSINLFVRDLNWPYKNVDYGVFKLQDYQNFEGNTIVINFQLLNYCLDTPNNNKIFLYCHDFPWISANFCTEKCMNYLTTTKEVVYCREDYILDFVRTINTNVKKCGISEAISEVLNV